MRIMTPIPEKHVDGQDPHTDAVPVKKMKIYTTKHPQYIKENFPSIFQLALLKDGVNTVIIHDCNRS
jgi:hypothetical protein